MAAGDIAFNKNYTFAPCDSLCVLDYRDGRALPCLPDNKETLCLDGEFDIVSVSEDAITLDKCDCYLDGELVGENMPVISIQDLACALKRLVEVKCVYSAEVDISKWLKVGENNIELTLYNNLRNLLGPHNMEEGECLTVRPMSFFKEKMYGFPGG